MLAAVPVRLLGEKKRRCGPRRLRQAVRCTSVSVKFPRIPQRNPRRQRRGRRGVYVTIRTSRNARFDNSGRNPPLGRDDQTEYAERFETARLTATRTPVTDEFKLLHYTLRTRLHASAPFVVRERHCVRPLCTFYWCVQHFPHSASPVSWNCTFYTRLYSSSFFVGRMRKWRERATKERLLCTVKVISRIFQ